MTRIGRLLIMGRLARWLGPWSSADARPQVETEEILVPLSDGRKPMRMKLYFPRNRIPAGALLILPGMHFLGPTHPRMERLAAILANAGVMVAAPFIPDYIALKFDPRSMSDAQAAFELLWSHPRRPESRPGVMSISFGSLPAIALAGHPSYAERLGGLLVFGGYANWREALRFCLEGSETAPHDPLNRPLLFLNLLEKLPEPVNSESLKAAWHACIERTWGHDDLKEDEARAPIAKELGQGVAAADYELFMQGCGLAPGGETMIKGIIEDSPHLEWLDPRPHLQGVRCPLFAVHAADDDVIDPQQSEWLVAAAPKTINAQRLLTGLYSHSGQLEVGPEGSGSRGALGELRTMFKVLDALLDVAFGAD